MANFSFILVVESSVLEVQVKASSNLSFFFLFPASSSSYSPSLAVKNSSPENKSHWLTLQHLLQPVPQFSSLSPSLTSSFSKAFLLLSSLSPTHSTLFCLPPTHLFYSLSSSSSSSLTLAMEGMCSSKVSAFMTSGKEISEKTCTIHH